MTNHQSSIESSRIAKSNEQRLKSLDEYEREKQNKKRLIKDSLNNQIKTAHFKFDSDDDADDQNDKPKPFIEKKLQLFDNHDEINVDEHFNNKKHSKKRTKLQDLQTRLVSTNDPRFQLSEKFLDDHEKDNEDDEDEHDNNNNQEISLEEEKKKSLAILDQMTNKKPSVSKPTTKMIRFDPSKDEHKIYELKSNVTTSQDTKPKSILKESKEPAPNIDSTRIYEFDESKLKSLFNKTSVTTNTSNEHGNFQFQFFSNDEPVVLPTPQPSTLSKTISNGKSKVLFNKPDDTSSDEEDHEQVPEAEVKDEIKNETFFFFDIDDRLKDGLESFVRTEDLDELERLWPAKRKEIAEALRTKHRKAIQRKDKHRVFNHRRRQNQHLKSDHMMFLPSDGAPPSGMGGRRAGPARPTTPPSKWDYVKTFYYDPVKWDFVKSIGFFAVAIYMIRDFASNDLLPMD